MTGYLLDGRIRSFNALNQASFQTTYGASGRILVNNASQKHDHSLALFFESFGEILHNLSRYGELDQQHVPLNTLVV